MTYPIPLVQSDGYDPLQPPPVVVPPINFSLVAPGVYRSGHPNRRNFDFLRGLHLKGIMWADTGSCGVKLTSGMSKETSHIDPTRPTL